MWFWKIQQNSTTKYLEPEYLCYIETVQALPAFVELIENVKSNLLKNFIQIVWNVQK